MSIWWKIYLIGCCAAIAYGTLVCREADGSIDWQMTLAVLFSAIFSWTAVLAFFIASNIGNGHTRNDPR